ncbi:MAG: TrkA C-terminal domain-containing protein [Planctomycetota bacterium]
MSLFPIITLLIVLAFSLLTVRVATVALTLTGISRSLARFQARSAFTGCGFTTAESEKLVNHPVRRRIILSLMFLGNAGIITTAGAVVAGFAQSGSAFPWYVRYGILAGGLGLLAALTLSDVVDRILQRWITVALKRYTSLDVRDYANVLHIAGEYGLGELYVEEGDWLADQTLADLCLTAEGVLVLGVERGGSYTGTPGGDFVIHAGDQLILYATSRSLEDLDRRKAGIGGALAQADAIAEKRDREAQENQAAENEQRRREARTPDGIDEPASQSDAAAGADRRS